MEKDKQQVRGAEAKLKQEAMRLRSERRPFSKLRDWLRCPQTEEVSEMVWHSEELDADLPLGWCTCIARQALCP